MAWPKQIVVRGITVEVTSWEELEEAIQRLGSEHTVSVQPTNGGENRNRSVAGMTPADRHIIERFLNNPRGAMLNSEIGTALGAERWAIKPKLDEWARRLGLANPDGDAFEAVNLGRAGRGYKLTELSAGIARSLIGQKGEGS